MKQIDLVYRTVWLNLRSGHSSPSSKRTSRFLTSNRGSDEYTGKPSPMPALGGASAENLRFLDYLIYEPVRTVLLHRKGVSVNVPAPERYAVHKLTVSSRRLTDAPGRAASLPSIAGPDGDEAGLYPRRCVSGGMGSWTIVAGRDRRRPRHDTGGKQALATALGVPWTNLAKTRDMKAEGSPYDPDLADDAV